MKAPAKQKVNKHVLRTLNNGSDNKLISMLKTDYDPDEITEKAAIAVTGSKAKLHSTEAKRNIFNAMTLFEFKNGTLLTTTVPEEYRAFGLNMLQQLQKDYNCALISEMATAELVTTTYIRTLLIQKQLDTYLEMSSLNKADLAYIDILSKEQDRAARQYLSALQTLRMLKVPALQLNLRTDTAIIGQNQIIQENKNV